MGNIAVNTANVSPEMKQVVDTYNLAMGVIGLKNIGQGSYEFARKLPEQTKKLLQESKSLRSELIARYLEWNRLSMKFKTPEANIDIELKKLLEAHEGVLGQLAGKVLRKFDTPEEIAQFLKTDKNGAFFWSGRTSKGEGVMNN